MHIVKIQIAVLFVLLGTLPVNATEVYKWVDAKGKVHFSDQSPDRRGAEPVSLTINSADAVAPRGNKVIMYSTSWCGYCKKARTYFRENNIAYTEYDIEQSLSAKSRYDRLGGRGVPLILIGEKRMSGFSVDSFERMNK